MDTSHVVWGRELKTLHFYRQIWWAGWIMAAIFGIATLILFARVSALESVNEQVAAQLKRVEAAEAGLSELKTDMQAVNDTYIQAWTNQQKTTEMVMDMATYLQDKRRGLVDRYPSVAKSMQKGPPEEPKVGREAAFQ